MRHLALQPVSCVGSLLLTSVVAAAGVVAAAQQTSTARPPLIPPATSQPAASTSRPPLVIPKLSTATASKPAGSNPAPTAQSTGAAASVPCPTTAATPAASNGNTGQTKSSRLSSWLSKTSLGQQAQSTISSVGANLPAGARPCGTAGAQQAIGQQATMTNSSANRGVLNTQQGLGSFPGCCGYNLTAYSCMRNNSQVLCDFDVTNQGNVMANAGQIYSDFHLVGTSGRIFGRSSAYFVDTNGSSFPVSQLSSGNAVRYVMVFDNVPNEYASVTLAQGQTLVQGVQLTAPQAQAPPSAPAAPASLATAKQ